MKRLLSFFSLFILLGASIADAAVGVEILDPGKLPEGVYTQQYPYPDTQTTTRYAPWWTSYHMSTPEHITDEKRGGEGGQIVITIAVSPHNDQIMYMGTDVGGLFKSTDGGENWYKSDADLPLSGIGGLAFDPDDEDTIYIYNSIIFDGMKVTDKPNDYFGIYKSTDAGLTFTQVLYARMTNLRRNDMVFDDDGALYIISYDGIFKTEDKGQNWENLGLENLVSASLYVHPEDKWIVAASNEQGIHYSADNGVTWETRNSGIGVIGGDRSNSWVTVNPEDSSHWVAVVNNVVYVTTDFGLNWSTLNTVPQYNDGTFHEHTAKVYRAHFGAANPDGDPRLYLVYNETINSLRYSEDLGGTWNLPVLDTTYDYVSWDKQEHPNNGYFAEGIGFHPTDPDIVYFSYCDVVFKSINGGADFSYSSSGFSGNRAVSFTFDPTDDQNIFITFTDKGLASTYASNPYAADYPVVKLHQTIPRYLGHISANAVAIDPRDSQHVLVAIGNWRHHILTKTLDGGQTWSQIPGSEAEGITLIDFHDNDQNIIYAGSLRSDDGGMTWELLDKHIKAVSPYNNDIVYSYDSETRKIIFRSDDRGENWYELARLGSSSIQMIYADLTDSEESQTLWIGTYSAGLGKVVKNTTGSTTLTMINEVQGLVKYDQIRFTTFEAITQNPSNSMHMIAAGRNSAISGKTPGPYESFDGGRTWRVVPGMPGQRDIWAAEFDPHRPRVFMGTSSGTMIYEYEEYQNWLEANQPDSGNELIMSARPGTEAGTSRLTASGYDEENNFKVMVYDPDTVVPDAPTQGELPPNEATSYILDTNLSIIEGATVALYELDENGYITGYGKLVVSDSNINGTRYQYKVAATADTYIRGDQLDILRGSETTVQVRRHSTGHTDGDRVAYYKFELSEDMTGVVETATLNMHTTLVYPSETLGASLLIHKVENDEWTDEGAQQLGVGVTSLRNGYPLPFSLDNDRIAEVAVTQGSALFTEITDFVEEELAGDGIITLGMMTSWTGPANTQYNIGLATRENQNAALRPYLDIRTVEEQAYAPTLKPNVPAQTREDITLGSSYTLDLSTLFEDYNGDVMDFNVSINGGEQTTIIKPNVFSFTPSTIGETILTFSATDGILDSSDTYTVTLVVANTSLTPELLVMDTSGLAGTNVEVTFRLKNIIELGGAEIEFSYDASKLVFQSIEYASNMIGAANTNTQGIIRFALLSANGISAAELDAAMITFEIKEGVASGTEIPLIVTEATASDSRIEKVDIFLTMTDGKITVEQAEQPPMVSNISFSGEAVVGETLTAVYTYTDFENVSEQGTLFRWLISDDGETYTIINNETGRNLLVTESYVGKYLKVEVTPVNSNNLTGASVSGDNSRNLVIELGDVFRDGAVTYKDALHVLQFTVEKAQMDAQQLVAADLNGDGNVDVTDVILILKKALAIEA